MKSRGAGINFRQHHRRVHSGARIYSRNKAYVPAYLISDLETIYVGRGSPLHFGKVQSVQDGVSSKDNRYRLLPKEEDPSVGPCSSHGRERSESK